MKRELQPVRWMLGLGGKASRSHVQNISRGIERPLLFGCHLTSAYQILEASRHEATTSNDVCIFQHKAFIDIRQWIKLKPLPAVLYYDCYLPVFDKKVSRSCARGHV